MIADGRSYIFQQDSFHAHKPKKTEEWLLNNAPPLVARLVADLLTRLQSLNYFSLGLIESRTKEHTHNTVDSLKAAIREEFTAIE